MAKKINIDDLSFIDDAVADKDIHDCKDFMTSFTKAVKEYGLYP